MARKPRLDLDGFHHIINRGVARSRVYKCDEDKEKFLNFRVRCLPTTQKQKHAILSSIQQE